MSSGPTIQLEIALGSDVQLYAGYGEGSARPAGLAASESACLTFGINARLAAITTTDRIERERWWLPKCQRWVRRRQ